MKSMQRVATGVAALLVLGLVPATVGAAGFANTAQSAASTGMAGVGTANPEEPAANFFNPAGMAFQDRWQLYGGATLLVPSAEYTGPDGEITEEAVDQGFVPPNLDISGPIGDQFAAGVGVTFPWGLGIEWPDDWHGRETFRNQSLETLNVNPNLAYKLPGLDLGVAAGVQLMRSALTQEYTAILRDDTEVPVAMGGIGHGIGATFGAQYRPTDQITVGLNYRSAVRLSFDGQVHFGEEVESTPFERRMIDQDISTALTVPHTVSAGIGWQPLEPTWVGLDVDYMSWSVYDRVEVQFSEQSPEGEPGEAEPPTVQEPNWEDAVAVRLGASHRVVDQWTARAGLGLDMTPVPDETVGPNLPDNHRFLFTAGVGWDHNPFRADLGYQFIALPEREVDNGTVDGTYRMHSHVLGLNVGYGF